MLMFMSGLRDVELRHLTALSAVAREGTFARAADRLGYTQSAVSQQIAALERLVGGAVFDRPGGPRPVELTPLGTLVLRHADAVLHRVDTAATEVDRFLAGEIGRIVVGTFQSVSVEVLPMIVGRLRAEQPSIDIGFADVDDPLEAAARVVDGELDLAFTVGPTDHPALEVVALGSDPFVVVGPRHDSERGRPVTAAELSSATLVGQDESLCQTAIDKGLRSVGVEPQYVFRSNDNTAVQAMVRAGMGLAILPLLAVDLTDDRLDVRPISPGIPDRVIELVRRNDRTSSPAADRFVQIAIDVCAALDERPDRRAHLRTLT